MNESIKTPEVSALETADSPLARVGNYRWLVCALLFFAATVNYIDRQVLAILKPTLQGQFDWTEIHYSWIVFSFQTAYAIGLFFVGNLMDKFGTKKGFSFSITVWSVAAMLHAWAVPIGVVGLSVVVWIAVLLGYTSSAVALSASVIGFIIVRFILGLGEAGNFPASIKTVAEWFPKKERALATGIFNAGTNVGALVTPLVVPLIVVAWGWYEAFIITGLIGFLWLIFWLIFYQSPEETSRRTSRLIPKWLVYGTVGLVLGGFLGGVMGGVTGLIIQLFSSEPVNSTYLIEAAKYGCFIGTPIGIITSFVLRKIFPPIDYWKLSSNELAYIQSDPPESTVKIPWKRLFPHRQTWAFAIGKFLTDPIWWVYLFWLPDFLNKQHGLDLKTFGLPLAVIYIIADVGSVGGGYISSALIKRGWTINKSRKTAMLVCALAVVPIVFASITSNLWVAVILIGIAAAAHQGWSANIFTIASDMFPKQAVGSVVGIGGMTGAVGGMLMSLLVGPILERTGNYVIIFIMAASAYLVALLVIHLLAPRLEPATINYEQ